MQNEISLYSKYDHSVLPLRVVGNIENLFSIMVGPRVGYENLLTAKRTFSSHSVYL